MLNAAMNVPHIKTSVSCGRNGLWPAARDWLAAEAAQEVRRTSILKPVHNLSVGAKSAESGALRPCKFSLGSSSKACLRFTPCGPSPFPIPIRAFVLHGQIMSKLFHVMRAPFPHVLHRLICSYIRHICLYAPIIGRMPWHTGNGHGDE